MKLIQNKWEVTLTRGAERVYFTVDADTIQGDPSKITEDFTLVETIEIMWKAKGWNVLIYQVTEMRNEVLKMGV